MFAFMKNPVQHKLLQTRLTTPARSSPTDDQLRRDRRTAMLVFALMIALLGGIIWLASLGGGTIPQGIEYWPTMP